MFSLQQHIIQNRMTTLPFPFKCFVEQNLGRQGLAFIYAILEFVMVLLLLVDGILGFFSAEFAKFFELEIPCFVCTRIDHHTSSYCNGCVCEAHKKDISSLAYCHAHHLLSDIRSMCEECLLSFSTHTDSNSAADCDRYKSLLGVMHKDIDYNDPKTVARFWSRDFEEGCSVIPRCSCCGELLSAPKHTATTTASIKAAVAPPPSPSHSPRAELLNPPELPPIPYSELKVISNNDDSDQLHNEDEEDVSNGGGESPAESGDELLEDGCKTPPSFIRGNTFFGIPLSDSSAQASPRLFNHSKSRKMSMDFVSSSDVAAAAADTNEGDGEILYGYGVKKKQVDRSKSFMALYMELDEERSASAVAANNAMAMITRLQAEKAAVKMEALQHQRMMEEHAEYYREELQVMKDMLLKREEELKDLESELEVYRQKFGSMSKLESEIMCEVDANEEEEEDYQEIGRRSHSHCVSPFSETIMLDCTNPDETTETDNNDYTTVVQHHSGEYTDENMVDSSREIENERARLLSLLSSFEKKFNAPSDEEGNHLPVKVEEEDQQHLGGNEKAATLTREMSAIRERLRTIEAESGFIKHATMTLQRGDEGIKLLTEIADNLRKLRAL